MNKRFFVLKNLNKTEVYEGRGKISYYDPLVMFEDSHYNSWDVEEEKFVYEDYMNQDPKTFNETGYYKEITEEDAKNYIDVLRVKDYLVGDNNEN